MVLQTYRCNIFNPLPTIVTFYVLEFVWANTFSQVIAIDRPDMNAQVAVICTPQIPSPWTDADFVMRRIVNPVCHAVAMACLLLVAVVHFVLPQLRDLIGNMVTTLAGCMIVARIANIVRIFVEYNGPVSYLTAGMCI